MPIFYVLRHTMKGFPCYQGQGKLVHTVYEANKYATRRDALKEGGPGWRVLRIRMEN